MYADAKLNNANVGSSSWQTPRNSKLGVRSQTGHLVKSLSGLFKLSNRTAEDPDSHLRCNNVLYIISILNGFQFGAC